MGKAEEEGRDYGATWTTRPKQRWRWGWHYQQHGRVYEEETPGPYKNCTKNVMVTTALYQPDLCKGLCNHHLMVLQSLEAGDPTYHAVQSLWDDAGNFSEPESEDEEMEVA